MRANPLKHVPNMHKGGPATYLVTLIYFHEHTMLFTQAYVLHIHTSRASHLTSHNAVSWNFWFAVWPGFEGVYASCVVTF